MAITDSNATYGADKTAVADVLNESGTQAALIVGTSAVEVKVGLDRLENRKLVTLFNNSNSTIYWGYDSTVTVSSGIPIARNQYVEWTVGDELSIFVIAGSANNNTRITEAA